MGKKTTRTKIPKMTKLDKLLIESGCDEEQSFMRFGKQGEDDICDEAVIGLTMGNEPERLVYSYDVLVDVHARELGKHPDNKGRDKDELWAEAAEHVDFNIVNALPYMNDPDNDLLAPIMIRKLER